MVRKAVSLICSIAALAGITLMEIPVPIRILLALIVVSFMIFTALARPDGRGEMGMSGRRDGKRESDALPGKQKGRSS